jgi:hypothetical protein
MAGIETPSFDTGTGVSNGWKTPAVKLPELGTRDEARRSAKPKTAD